MLCGACASTFLQPAHRLQRHKCNICLTLSAWCLALHRFHKSSNDSSTPRLFAGRLDRCSSWNVLSLPNAGPFAPPSSYFTR